MSEKMVETRRNNVLFRQQENFLNKRVFGENNKVWISGVFENEFEFSHEIYGEKFYKNTIKTLRKSGVEDFIPVIVSEVTLKKSLRGQFKDKYVEIAGQYRSYNRWGLDGKSHLDLFMFVLHINICENINELTEEINTNAIYLKGTICKPTIFRETPLGREITDLFIAVNRLFGKSDYIPCIAWNRNAIRAGELKVGEKIELYGRIQSREYFKRFSEDFEEGELRRVNEISIIRFTIIDSDK